MVVLSLFDGMSCGRLALADAGINVTEYHASEIDLHAIKVTKANWPETIHIGSVVDVIVNQHYDLLIGGSPCQSFSFAGKRKGMATKDEQEILTLSHYLQLKADGYEFEGQSYLFWEYVRILQECREINPNIKFLLENVLMSEKWERVITQTMGVKPIQINSALVSAQNRNRLYWTNIGLQPQGLFGFEESIINQPKDCGILLKDILETNVAEKYYLSDKMLNWLNKHADKRQVDVKELDGNQKSACLTSSALVKQNLSTDYIRTVIQLNLNTESGGLHSQMELVRVSIDNDKATTLDASYYKGFGVRNGKCRQVVQVNAPAEMLNENQQAKFNPNVNADKANTLTLAQGRMGSSSEYMDSISKIYALTSRIRRLTPTECERLQTVPDGYTNHVSDTQRYKMLGNGWTIKVISHIFSYILTT
jgi:DNA (cytosine-5)-methyltransferase 3A